MTNKYIKATYKLYDVTDGKKELLEETQPGIPFAFISGMGVALDEFEKLLAEKQTGEEYDITLTPEQAYGEHVAERVFDLDKAIFSHNGKFDNENIFEGAIVPLQNAEGERFFANIVKIGNDKVTVDLNHPWAGKTLNFKGSILESHEATAEEMAALVKAMSGEGGCGGSCENCGGGCGGHGEGEGHCEGHGDGHCGGHGHGEGHCGGHGHGDGHCGCGHHHEN